MVEKSARLKSRPYPYNVTLTLRGSQWDWLEEESLRRKILGRELIESILSKYVFEQQQMVAQAAADTSPPDDEP